MEDYSKDRQEHFNEATFFNDTNIPEEDTIIAKRSIQGDLTSLFIGIFLIVASLFLLFKNIKTLEKEAILFIVALILVGGLLLLIGILGLRKQRILMVIKNRQLYILNEGEFALCDIVKVSCKRKMTTDNHSTKYIEKSKVGKMIINFSDGKKIIIKNVDNVRQSTIMLNDILGL